MYSEKRYFLRVHLHRYFRSSFIMKVKEKDNGSQIVLNEKQSLTNLNADNIKCFNLLSHWGTFKTFWDKIHSNLNSVIIWYQTTTEDTDERQISMTEAKLKYPTDKKNQWHFSTTFFIQFLMYTFNTKQLISIPLILFCLCVSMFTLFCKMNPYTVY